MPWDIFEFDLSGNFRKRIFILHPDRSTRLITYVAFSEATDPECNGRSFPQQCQRVTDWRTGPTPAEGKADSKSKSDPIRDEVRSVLQYGIQIQDETVWFYNRLLDLAASVDERNNWNFEIAGFYQPPNLLRYHAEQAHFYHWPIDIVAGNESAREISVSVQSSRPDDCEGCDLELNNGDRVLTTPRDHGAATMYPTYMLRRVTPILSGERCAGVRWVQGLKSFN